MSRLLAVTVVAAPLLCGAARPWAIAPLCAVTLMAFWAVRRSRSDVRIDAILGIGLVLLAATLLQAIPLPDPIVRVISPLAWEIERGALRPLAAAAEGAKTLSLSPSSTWIEVSKVALLVLVYCVARETSSRSSRPVVAEWVVIAGLLVAAIGIVHALVDAQAVYGWYRPPGVQRVVGPFVNGNHQAGLLALSAAVSVGLAFDARGQRGRALWVAGAAVMLAGGVLTGSRGGIVAIVMGLLGGVALRYAGRGRIPRWLPAAVVGVVLVVVTSRGDQVVEVFSDTDTKKLEIWKPAPELIRDFWTAGAGRGAFTVAYRRYQRLPDDRTYTHVENVPLQLVMDYGVPLGGLLVLFASAALVWAVLRRHASSHDAAAVAGLAALSLHNLVDFNLEIPGVAVPAVAILGSLAVPRRQARRHLRAPLSVLGGGCAVLAALGLFLGVRRDIRGEEERVRSAAARQSGFDEVLGAALLRHPADHVLPLLAAAREVHRAGSGSEARPLAWVNRALELFPGSHDAHLLAARWLARAGRDSQAVLEYRMAIDARPAMVEAILREMANRWPRFERLRDVARDRDACLLRWNLIAAILDRGGTRAEAERADMALLKIDPVHAQALARRAWRALDDGRYGDALAFADALGAVDPSRADRVRGHALLRGGRATDAMDMFSRAARMSPGDPEPWLDLARAALAAGDADGVRNAIERARGAVAGDRDRAELELRAGAILESAGHEAAALRAYHHAATMGRGTGDAWRHVLRLAERLGDIRLEATAKRALADPEADSGVGPDR